MVKEVEGGSPCNIKDALELKYEWRVERDQHSVFFLNTLQYCQSETDLQGQWYIVLSFLTYLTPQNSSVISSPK